MNTINEGPENRGGAGHPIRTPPPPGAPRPRPTIRALPISEETIKEHMRGVCKQIAPDAATSFMSGVIYTIKHLKEIGLL